ncbi:MAG TPA: hypothetical protein VN151_04000 [Terracidiphilus sp.]|nr:hypothetical protein [Terracidiphilus sp.]
MNSEPSAAATPQDLNARLQLIEEMISEGRRSTQSWGWTFLLWGVAYYVAIFWAAWSVNPWSWPVNLFDGNHWAWPVTMFSTAVLTLVIGTRRNKGKPRLAIGRTISSIWFSIGISMLLLFPALSIAGRIDHHSFIAIVCAMLGVSNGACGMILRWPAELASACVWWCASIFACFGSEQQAVTVFLVAIFLCQFVFGAYAMLLEAREQRAHGAVHA